MVMDITLLIMENNGKFFEFLWEPCKRKSANLMDQLMVGWEWGDGGLFQPLFCSYISCIFIEMYRIAGCILSQFYGSDALSLQ